MMKFERLDVWQHGLGIMRSVHALADMFPDKERFVLTTQIKRAADSICLNIAEGSQGTTDPGQARFLGIALRSAIEVIACLHLGRKRGFISEDDFSAIYSDTETLIKMLQAFRRRLNAKPS